MKNEIRENNIMNLIEGKCTGEGTLRYVQRSTKDKNIPLRNFRKPILELEPN